MWPTFVSGILWSILFAGISPIVYIVGLLVYDLLLFSINLIAAVFGHYNNNPLFELIDGIARDLSGMINKFSNGDFSLIFILVFAIFGFVFGVVNYLIGQKMKVGQKFKKMQNVVMVTFVVLTLVFIIGIACFKVDYRPSKRKMIEEFSMSVFAKPDFPYSEISYGIITLPNDIGNSYHSLKIKVGDAEYRLIGDHAAKMPYQVDLMPNNVVRIRCLRD